MAKKGGWQEFDGPPSVARPAASASSTPKGQQRVRVQRTKAGKGGKTVTVISGLEITDSEALTLLKALKARVGTGGAMKEGLLELQGDQVAAVLEELEKAGFRPKQAGG